MDPDVLKWVLKHSAEVAWAFESDLTRWDTVGIDYCLHSQYTVDPPFRWSVVVIVERLC